MDNKNVSILIPAYNPTEDLIPLIEGLIKNKFNVVVVNDGSNKNSNKIFKKLNKKIIFLKHSKNMGKGQALKTGFEYILKNLPCFGVITADADGQHLLSDIINISDEMKSNSDELILGSRKLNDTTPFKSKFGNSITRMVFKIATNVSIYDTQTGLRGIPYKYLQSFLKIEGQRYEYEINMLLYCAKNKIAMKEIPITTVYINNNKASSFNIFKDSIRIYKCILKNSNVLQSILYAISGILSFLIDFILLLIFNIITANIFNKEISLLISVIVARVISSIFNFFFNKKIVFQSNCSLIASLCKYYLLAIIVLTFNYLLLDLLTIHLKLNITISKIIVELSLFIVNFFISKIIIFKNVEHLN